MLPQSESRVFNSCMLWHSRLGVASIDMLRKLIHSNSILGFEALCSNDHCQHCAFIPKILRDFSNEKYDQIKSDVCGIFAKSLKTSNIWCIS